MKGKPGVIMQTVLPREEEVEAIFSQILASPDSCKKLMDVFYDAMDDNHLLESDDPKHFSKVLFYAYQNGDVTALLLKLCGKSMFDLLRDAYLIPKKFHGKAGMNPVLLTNPDGELLPATKKIVSSREYSKFKEIYKNHECAPRSKLYLADGYDIVRSYVGGSEMNITEKKENKRRGIMILYALPDTKKLGLTEAQAYAVVWNTFHNIQKEAPHAIVYYGQETGLKQEQTFDEIGILLPIREFEKKMLHHLSEVDGLVLTCREKMIKKAGVKSLEL